MGVAHNSCTGTRTSRAARLASSDGPFSGGGVLFASAGWGGVLEVYDSSTSFDAHSTQLV
jgi:hypothetical protein